MRRTAENGQTEMQVCWRCEDRAFEYLKTYSVCHSCGYSSDLDFDQDLQLKSRVEFMALVSKKIIA